MQGALGQINDNYAERFASAKYVSEWNNRITDFLVTVYGDLTDYLLGKKWMEEQSRWVETDPPRPEQAALVAADLTEMLATLTKLPYSKLLEERNKETIRELYGHLSPHITQPSQSLSFER